MSNIKQAYVTEDNSVFATKAEAVAYERRPKILAAFMATTSDNEELSNWLMDNTESVMNAFDAGTIRRVTKADRRKLSASFSELIEREETANVPNAKLAFLVENAESIMDTFRWPTVKRMTDEEKTVATHNTLMLASENNEELVSWVIENRTQILEAYEAGKVKRTVSDKATAGLARYRAEKAAEKAKAEAEAQA